MTRQLLVLRATVKDGERAFLTRNGRLERVLGPGRHRLLDLRRELAVETFQVVAAEFPAARYAVIKAERPDLAAELFAAVETRANEVAIVSRRICSGPGRRACSGRSRPRSMSSASIWAATRRSTRAI